MSDNKEFRKAQMEKFANLLEDILKDINPDIEFSWKKMFGGAGYYANGVMFAGMYHDHTIGLKLKPEHCEALLANGGAQEGFGKNTVDVPETMLTDTATLTEWVGKSLDYAASRPPKKKKQSKKK